MIPEKETFKKFGYYSSQWKPKSSKRVITKCDKCSKIRVTRKNYSGRLCPSCAALCRKQRYLQLFNYNWIFQKYMTERKTTIEIATILNCERTAVGNSLKRFNILPQRKGRRTGKNHHMFGKHHSEETRKKMREARKHRRFPKYRTKPELIFEYICKKYSIAFHYVGDGSLWVGKKGEKQLNPDFMEANGKKICVDILGDYWHSPLLNRNMKEYASLKYRRKHYRKYGWVPIFIWESDLKRKDAEQFVLNELRKSGIFYER